MPAFLPQFIIRHRARDDDGALQWQRPALDAAVQVFGHETVAGEYHLACAQAAVRGFQPMPPILFVPAQHFTVRVYARAAA